MTLGDLLKRSQKGALLVWRKNHHSCPSVSNITFIIASISMATDSCRSMPSHGSSLRLSLSRYLISACLAVTLVSSTWAAEALDATYSCAVGTEDFSFHARDFLSLTARMIEAPDAADAVLDLYALSACGDEDAAAELSLLASQSEAGSGLLATAVQVEVSRVRPTQLLEAIAVASVAEAHRAELLEIASIWMVQLGSEVVPTELLAATEWTQRSADSDIARAGQDLRAMYGDQEAENSRATRLMACASLHGMLGERCLAWHEMHTADLSLITSRWPSATPEQKYWLAIWSNRKADSQRFFQKQLPHEDSRTQYQILTEPLGPGGELAYNRILGALVVIEQALDEPKRRPPSVSIDFANDHNGSWFGIRAHEADESYPMALQVAFDELTTYPDASDLMQALADLDHPWLSTQAGLWLMRHGRFDMAMRGLRYTLEEDGLPPRSILQQLTPSSGRLPESLKTLFVATVNQGDLGKWKALANEYWVKAAESPEVLERIVARGRNLPALLEAMGMSFPTDQDIQASASMDPRFREELDAVQWAAEMMRPLPDVLDRYINAFATQRSPIWHTIAMAMAYEMGRTEQALLMARDLIHSSPWQRVRDHAKLIIEHAETGAVLLPK